MIFAAILLQERKGQKEIYFEEALAFPWQIHGSFPESKAISRKCYAVAL
jgi:hypothetical protein